MDHRGEGGLLDRGEGLATSTQTPTRSARTDQRHQQLFEVLGTLYGADHLPVAPDGTPTRTTTETDGRASVRTLEELTQAYLHWARTYYLQSDGEPSGEVADLERACHLLNLHSGARSPREFSPNRFREFRDSLIEPRPSRGGSHDEVDSLVYRWKGEGINLAVQISASPYSPEDPGSRCAARGRLAGPSKRGTRRAERGRPRCGLGAGEPRVDFSENGS